MGEGWDEGKTWRSKRARGRREWLSEVGLPSHSSHKFRHGHAGYGLQNSNDIADLKAVNQNLMHSNLSITDGVYGMLSVDAVSRRIANLGKFNQNQVMSVEELRKELEKLIIRISSEYNN